MVKNINPKNTDRDTVEYFPQCGITAGYITNQDVHPESDLCLSPVPHSCGSAVCPEITDEVEKQTESIWRNSVFFLFLSVDGRANQRRPQAENVRVTVSPDVFRILRQTGQSVRPSVRLSYLNHLHLCRVCEELSNAAA